jgi:hypothetical protein
MRFGRGPVNARDCLESMAALPSALLIPQQQSTNFLRRPCLLHALRFDRLQPRGGSGTLLHAEGISDLFRRLS